MSDFLTWLFGQKHEPLPPQPWPTAEDVASAREYKKKYGNFNEQDIEGAAPVHKNDETQPYRTRVPASAKAQMLPKNKALDYLNDGRGASQPGLLSPEVADRLYAAQIAAQRNPVAALGFDTSRMIHTVDEPDRLSARGAYLPSDDKMWLGTNSPTTPVHESLHRGMEMLRRESPSSLNNRRTILKRVTAKWTSISRSNWSLPPTCCWRRKSSRAKAACRGDLFPQLQLQLALLRPSRVV